MFLNIAFDLLVLRLRRVLLSLFTLVVSNSLTSVFSIPGVSGGVRCEI